MTKSNASAQSIGSNWPLYDAISDVFLKAGLPPPTRFEVLGLEIADEEAGLKLVIWVSKAKATKIARALCIRKVLDGLHQFRLAYDGQTEPAINQVASQVQKDKKDPLPTIQRLLGDPDTGRELKVDLLRGAATVPSNDLPIDNEMTDAGDWAFRWCASRTLFRAAVLAAERKRPKRFDAVRRMRGLAASPSKKRLLRLLRDARRASPMIFSSVISLLRIGARKSVFKGKELPRRWLSEVAEDKRKLRRVASTAHKWLITTYSKDRRPRDHRMELFADRIGTAFARLAGKVMTYSKPTSTSRSNKKGQPYGPGLEFMLSALRLANASSDVSTAQHQIDRIRGFSKLKERFTSRS